MMMYIDAAADGRLLGASADTRFNERCVWMAVPAAFDPAHLDAWRLAGDTLVPAEAAAAARPTPLDRIEAQALYTAIMTDTLLEEEDDV